MKKLIITRHGESLWNNLNKFTGWSNIDLTNYGRKQAFKTSLILKKNNLIPNTIFTSKLIRSINTAEIIRGNIDINLDLISSWRLNERNYGMLDGFNREEAYKKYGKSNIEKIRKNFFLMPYIIDNKLIHDHGILMNDDNNSTIGESNNMVYKRVLPFWDNVIKLKLIENDTVLIVSHKNTLRCIMKIIENLNYDNFKDTDIKNGELIIYKFNDNLKLMSKQYLH